MTSSWIPEKAILPRTGEVHICRARPCVFSAHLPEHREAKKDAYTAEEIDILVVYIVVEDAWYVVPVAAFAPRLTLTFYPSGCLKKNGGLYEQYREAWESMKEEPANRDLASSRVLGHLLPR